MRLRALEHGPVEVAPAAPSGFEAAVDGALRTVGPARAMRAEEAVPLFRALRGIDPPPGTDEAVEAVLGSALAELDGEVLVPSARVADLLLDARLAACR